jgi:SpoVK/Ycf46/Vps4 family AAA+-type ATPase
MNKNQRTNADITALLRARNTLLWIVTREEGRVERAIMQAAGTAKYDTLCWDCADGITQPETGQVVQQVPDPLGALGYIQATKERRVYILRDLHRWMDPPTLRKLRNLARSLQSAPRNEARSMIVLTPSSEVPPELAGHAIVIDYPLPEREEMGQILDDALSVVPEEISATVTNGVREAAIDAALGLEGEPAAAAYAKSLVTKRTVAASEVAAEKRRVISGIPGVTWFDPDPRGLDAVGGYDLLKERLGLLKLALGQKARAYGLPPPKGLLLMGVSGCGKSLTAKAVPTAWGLPLLRVDLGAVRSKYVGESETNIRRVYAVAEAVAPCVVWFDEIEKSLAGATGPQGDGGVGADTLGSMLSWMQECKSPVVVIATANDVSGLPPEFLRKGRFDDIFWVDLPTLAERREVLVATLKQFKRDPSAFDLDAIARATDTYTGAEIAALVPDALLRSFADGEREPTTEDMLAAAKAVVPLAVTASEKIGKLREWAKTRARPASRPEETSASTGRALDF